MDEDAKNEVKTGPGEDEAIVSCGLVLRMPLERVPELKAALASIDGVRIVYQRTSIRFLKIVEEDPIPRLRGGLR